MNNLKYFFTIPLLAILFAPRTFAQYPPTTYPWDDSNKGVIGKPIPHVIRRTLSPQNTTDLRIHESENNQSEMSVAIDPFNPGRLLVGANTMQFNPPPQETYFYQGYYHSSSGGTTWAGNDILPGTSRKVTDPAVAFDADGNAYFHYLDGSSGPVLGFVQKSTDGGISWEDRVLIPGTSNSVDKGHIAVDATDSPFRNNVYVAFTDWLLPSSPIVVSRSTNGGESFEDAVSISEDENNAFSQGVSLALGPNGEVYAAWAIEDFYDPDPGSDAIGFNKSLDGAGAWEQPRRIFNIQGSRNVWNNKNPQQLAVRMNDFPCIAVDRSGGIWNGTVYIVWGNYGAEGDRADILFSKSTDGGDTWSNPFRVNDDNTSNDQWFPWITVNPYGVINILFYDSRNDPNNQLTEVWVAQSADGGTSFSNFQVSDVAFTPLPILGRGVAPGYMGDYIGITSAAGKTYACWMDNREGVYQAYVDIIDTYQADLLALAYSNKSLEAQATRYNSARHLVKGGGNLHEQFSSGGEIFYRRSSNDGATWELAKRISAGDGNNGGGCLTYNEANSLHLVWQRQVASNQYDVMHSRSTDNGVSWSSPAVLPDGRGIEVSSDQSEGAKPVVTVGKFDQGSTLLAAFASIHGLRFRTSTDDGQTWQVPTPDTLVGGNNARLRSPSLAGGESYISITYDYADDDNSPYSRIFNGSTWSNEFSVGKATGVPAGAYSSVAIDANKNPIATWSGLYNSWSRGIVFRTGYSDNTWSDWFVVFGSGPLLDWDYPSVAYYNRNGSGQYGVAIAHGVGENGVQLIQYDDTHDPPSWLLTSLSTSGAWPSITQEDYSSGNPMYCWTDQSSSPHQVVVGSPDAYSITNSVSLEQKRVAVVSHRTLNATLELEFEPMRIVTASGDTILVPFKTSTLRQKGLGLSDIWNYLGSDVVNLPANARSLIVSKHFLTRGPSLARRSFFLRLLNSNGTPLGVLDTTTISSTIAANIAPYAGMRVIVRPQVLLAGINPASITTAVGDVFTLPNSQPSKPLAKQTGSQNEHAELNNYPNPFNPSTLIEYSIPTNAQVDLVVYDMLGRQVAVLESGPKPAGTHRASFDASNLASGIYVYRLQTDNVSIVRKMVVVK